MPWLEDGCEEDCVDVEVDEGTGAGIEDCVEVTVDEVVGATVDVDEVVGAALDVDEVVDGVNRFVLTTIFEKSKTGGKEGSVGPGPIIGGLLTFPLDDDPDKLDVWDVAGVVDGGEGVGVYFEVGGELVEVELVGVFTLTENELSVFFTELISLLFLFYGLTVNCLFGIVVCKLFLPLSVDATVFLSMLWLSFALLLLAELDVVCPDEGGLETVVVEDEIVFCVCEIVGLLVVGAIVSVLTGV